MAEDVKNRCDGRVREDVMHCLWICQISRQCWDWGEFLLKSANFYVPANGCLSPANVLIAEPLPVDWGIQGKFWHVLRAVLCWQLWKDRNVHFFKGKQSNPVAVIYKAWHRMGVYMRMEWRSFAKEVREGKITYGEAELAMQAQFGSNPAFWSLHELILEVPPVRGPKTSVNFSWAA